jgi:hypothetical protein
MWCFVFYEDDHFRKTSAIIVVEADQSGACLRADAQPISGDYGQKYVSRKHEMWLARAQEHSEEEDRGAGSAGAGWVVGGGWAVGGRGAGTEDGGARSERRSGSLVPKQYLVSRGNPRSYIKEEIYMHMHVHVRTGRRAGRCCLVGLLVA